MSAFKKECFPSKSKFKITPTVEGPLEVLQRINNNAYKINFPEDYEACVTLNVTNLAQYLKCDTLENLRVNSSQQQENNRDLIATMRKSSECGRRPQEIAPKAQGLAQRSKQY